jgi:hypothetical protein
MEREIEAWSPHGYAALMQRFLLACGQPFHAQPLPSRYRRAPMKECFANAIAIAKRTSGRIAYVEGYAMRADMPLLIHHAWCADGRGNVIDPTWNNPEDCHYFGRVLSLAEWERETDRTGTLSAFDGMGLNHVFMFDTVPGLADTIERVRKERPRTLATHGAEGSSPAHHASSGSDQTSGESTA